MFISSLSILTLNFGSRRIYADHRPPLPFLLLGHYTPQNNLNISFYHLIYYYLCFDRLSFPANYHSTTIFATISTHGLHHHSQPSLFFLFSILPLIQFPPDLYKVLFETSPSTSVRNNHNRCRFMYLDCQVCGKSTIWGKRLLHYSLQFPSHFCNCYLICRKHLLILKTIPMN